jgi:hypothetical protein
MEEPAFYDRVLEFLRDSLLMTLKSLPYLISPPILFIGSLLKDSTTVKVDVYVY